VTTGEDELWIVVRKWNEFQHYRDREPPWIKNYTRLLSDPNYLSLTPHQCAVLHRLWLEYARSGCQLRANTASLSRQLGVKVTKRTLEALNHAGFIDFLASTPLATRARTREAEIDKEQTKSKSGQTEASYAGLDWTQITKEMP
jgi:hypothetical protein